MERQKRLKPVDIVLTIVLGFVLLFLGLSVYSALWRPPTSYSYRCKNRLSQLGKALLVYTIVVGDHRYYPYIGTPTAPGRHWREHGANFLIACYWAKIAPDAALLICPATRDGNDDGKAFGNPNWGEGVALKPEHCSYAGLKAPEPGQSYHIGNVSTDMIMACDDTDGDRNNHPGGKNVLYGDGSVVFYPEETMRSLDEPPYNGRLKD